MRHGELYAREYGWGSSFESIVATVVADFAASEESTRSAA